MKLKDQDDIAEDLSAGRRLVKEAGDESLQEDVENPTASVMEVRGFLPRSAASRSREAAAGNMGPTPTHLGNNQRLPEATRKPPVVWVPVVPMSGDSFEILQKFEGTVVSVTGDSLIARLVDKTNPGPEEEAEIPLPEVMPGDHGLVKPGATFYWVIGYRREGHGQVSRSSVIRFRRLPSWSTADVERARKAAENFLSFLDLERANNAA